MESQYNGLIGFYVIFILLSLLGNINCTSYTKTKTIHPNGQSPALTPEEMYRDMFTLGSDNFTDSVLRHTDPWIVIFHDGSVDKSWKTMATNMRGLCWIGLVDVRSNKELLHDMMFNSREEVARVYPYGDRNVKERKWTRIKTPEAAIKSAMAKLPDKTINFTGNDAKDIFTDSFLSIPSRFPVYLITDQEETSNLFKAISTRFEKYFNFGKVINPTEAELVELGLGSQSLTKPCLFVMVSIDGTVENIHAIKYDESKFGTMNYTSILQFLFAINLQYRHFLPGNNMANSQQEAEMSDIVRLEEKRFDIQFPRSASSHANDSKKAQNQSKRRAHHRDELNNETPNTIKMKPDKRSHVINDEL